MNKPVSVCLLSYNLDHFISRVIESVINQTFKDFEFIISDDCSTDRTWDIIKGYAERFDFIRAVRQDRNLGMVKNANFCFSLAQGDYIALLSHDDPIHKSLLEKWIDLIEKDKNISFVFNDYLVENGIPSHKRSGADFKAIMDGNSFLRKHMLKKWGSPIRIGAFIRKSCINEVGGMDERFGILADIDLWMRLSANHKVGYVDEPLIEVFNVWKEDYPKDYTDFSWNRLFLLFEVHAVNIKRIYGENIFRWFWFRVKVNIQIFKWLTYGLIKRREILISGLNSSREYYFFPLSIYRFFLSKFFKDD